MPESSRRPSLRCGWLGVLLAIVGLGLVDGPGEAAPQLRTSYRISGSSFLRAFREVVEEPRTWTVRIRRMHPRTERWEDASLGVIVRSDGLVLTKASEAMGDLRVKLPDRTAGYRDATLLAADNDLDLALLRIDMRDLRPLPTVRWADGDPEVGRWVVTPSIYSSPATVGIVSVPRRTIPRTTLPGMLGVTFEGRTAEGLPRGAVIARLVEDGPADRGGLVEGDQILAVDGLEVRSYGRARDEIAKRRPGDVVALRIRHEDDEVETIRVRLAQPNGDLLISRGLRYDMMNTLGGKLSERRSRFPSAIQHDSVIEPSDCGGAAVNLDGEAVGINIARAGRTESLMLPIDLVRPVVERMIRESGGR